MTRYDTIGTTYAQTRRPDPRIAAAISTALGGSGGVTRSVINVVAGTGSYEPPQTVVAVEPSAVMIAQRPPDAAPAVRAVAEALPLPENAVDAALAILTVHHWSDLESGVAELQRVARRRIVVLTWDSAVAQQMWLNDYLPEPIGRQQPGGLGPLLELLGDARVEPVPVPHDCIDGFAAAFWRRPWAYLDPAVRAGISSFALNDEAMLAPGLKRLQDDLATGRWHGEHADLLDLPALDAGYRLVIAECTK